MARNMDQIVEEMKNYTEQNGIKIQDFITNPVAMTYLETSAHQVELLEGMIDDLQSHFYIDTTPGEGLDKRLSERGLVPRFAGTRSSGFVIAAKASPFITASDIPKDTVFKTFDDSVYLRVKAATPLVVGQTYVLVPVECMEIGRRGNLIRGTELTYSGVDINEVETLTVDANGLSGGTDGETDDDVRKRIKEDIQKTATSANKYHCVKWAKEVVGVGDAICIPMYDGPYTAKLLIVDLNREPASTELVNTVQNYIDPGATGLGEGVAPIGLMITVAPAQQINISVSVKLTLSSGYSFEHVVAAIEAEIKSYLRDSVFKEKFIRYSSIGDIIYNTEGIADYRDMLLNGTSSNIAIEEGYVPVLEGCTWTEQTTE